VEAEGCYRHQDYQYRQADRHAPLLPGAATLQAVAPLPAAERLQAHPLTFVSGFPVF